MDMKTYHFGPSRHSRQLQPFPTYTRNISFGVLRIEAPYGVPNLLGSGHILIFAGIWIFLVWQAITQPKSPDTHSSTPSAMTTWIYHPSFVIHLFQNLSGDHPRSHWVWPSGSTRLWDGSVLLLWAENLSLVANL